MSNSLKPFMAESRLRGFQPFFYAIFASRASSSAQVIVNCTRGENRPGIRNKLQNGAFV